MPQQQRYTFVVACLCFVLPLFAAWPARAADIVICNTGAVPFSVATATRESEFIVGHVWRHIGWYRVEPRGCANLADPDNERVYFAFMFTDFRDRWGSAQFSVDRDSSWENAGIHLCVANDRFEYTRSGSDPGGPCKDGYFPIPASLHLEPDGYTSSYTMDVGLNETSVAGAVGPLAETGDSDGGFGQSSDARTGERGEPISGKIADIFWDALRDAIKEQLESTDSAAPDSVEAPGSGPPKPFESGTLTALLFGRPIVRRASGDGVWFAANGERVYGIYELDGATASDLVDPPEQRQPGDAEVDAAQRALNESLAGFAANRPAVATSEGRLYYGYTSAVGVAQHAVNVVTLDFAKGLQLGDLGGYTGYEIPCRSAWPCVLAWDDDGAGKLSSVSASHRFRIYFANTGDGPRVWSALLELRRLYPAEPAVMAR
jgi:uncharacterized membrane protein